MGHKNIKVFRVKKAALIFNNTYDDFSQILLLMESLKQ